MSNKRTVNSNDLTPGKLFAVRGKLGYSRLTSQIDGDELRKDITRRRQKGWMPIERPYTTATINGAEVICADANNLTPEERYAVESLYVSTASRNQGEFSFTANNKGNSLPYIAVSRPDDPSVADQIQPDGELASGLDVTLIMRVFKGKPNNGVSLDGVIVNEPIRYYNNAQAGAGLSQLGIKFNSLPQGAMNTPDNAGIDDAAAQPAYAEHDDTPFSSGPAAAPAPAPIAGVSANGYGAVAPNPMAGAPAGAPVMNPFGGGAASAPAANEGGIRYNPAANGANQRSY